MQSRSDPHWSFSHDFSAYAHWRQSSIVIHLFILRMFYLTEETLELNCQFSKNIQQLKHRIYCTINKMLFISIFFTIEIHFKLHFY